MVNNQQFSVVSQLFNEFYSIEEPKYESLQSYKNLKKRLKKANVLNVNVIENEHNKIKKESNGTGARLDTKMDPKDEKMKMFNQHLNRILVEMNSEDYYLQHKYRVHKAKEKSKNLEKSTQLAVRMMRQMEEDKKPVIATQLIDENVVNLTN